MTTSIRFAAIVLLAVLHPGGFRVAAAAGVADVVQLTLHADRPGPKIEPNIYGQFSEHLGRGIYEGIWVGENSPIPNTRGYRNDVIAALKRIHVPVIRWPGGCFADNYNWRDGIGPRAARPVRLNQLWGGVEETNAFGTHEFLDFAELIGASSYVSVPVGAGTPQSMSDWLEYMLSSSQSTLAQERRRNGRDQPFRVSFVGIGNESWGCGGQMRPEYYADVFRDFASFVRVPAENPLQIAASGPAGDDYRWMEVLMADAAKLAGPGPGRGMDAISLHYYTLPSGKWAVKGAATGFSEGEWFDTFAQTEAMGVLIAKHSAIMDKYDPAKRIGLFVDEWGTWYDPDKGSNPGFLYQQNTLRDALVAAVNFNIFHAHADRVRMTNIAQMINVLQALILTDKGKMIVTPTYHAFDLYKVFQGAVELPVDVGPSFYSHHGQQMPRVSASAGRAVDGTVYIGLVNVDPQMSVALQVTVDGMAPASVSGSVLTAAEMDARNTFESPHALEPAKFGGASLSHGHLAVKLPAKSLVVLALH
jgi:alpha-N-arabinofuranosidase